MAKPKGSHREPPPSLSAPPNDGGIYVSGKLVIISVAVLAVLAAGFSWWYRYSSTRRSAHFWGGQNARLIRDAAQVHLVTLGPLGPDHDHGSSHYHLQDGLVKVIDRREVTQAPGLVHLRNELLMDRSFESHSGVLASANDWHYGLEFRDSETSPALTVFFSSDCQRLMRHPPTIGPGVAMLAPSFAAGLKTVFGEWLAESR